MAKLLDDRAPFHLFGLFKGWNMSGLRIAGLLIGVVGLVSTFMIYRGPRWNRFYFTVFSLFNIALIAVTINPNVVNFLRDLLALQEYQYSRLIALLIASNIFFMFFSFYTTSKIESLHLQFDRLVRSLGAKGLEGDIELSGDVKPVMILIPAYNEADNLKELLPQIPKQVNGVETGALIVDDGSDDGTFEVASGMDNVWVVRNVINRGGGAALRLGYDILKEAGVDVCVTMDADGQHRPDEAHRLIEPVLEERCDIEGEQDKDRGRLFFQYDDIDSPRQEDYRPFERVPRVSHEAAVRDSTARRSVPHERVDNRRGKKRIADRRSADHHSQEKVRREQERPGPDLRIQLRADHRQDVVALTLCL
jgi:hypothetical protein